MIWVRVVRGITDHFPARAPEWALAGILFAWGLRLLQPDEVFNSPIWAGLQRIAPEAVWGGFCAAVGAARLTALCINGTFPRFQRSPHIRALASLVSCFFWLQITLGFWASPVPNTGLAVYPFLLLLDMSNVFRAAGDARMVDDIIRRERRGDGRRTMV